MPRRVAGPEIERLIQLLAKLPGLGSRSARRAALTLVKRRDALLVPLVRAMAEVEEKVRVCHVCGNIDTASPCAVCTDPIRDDKVLVVVEDVADLWALERAGATTARYHVLGGVLSPLDGVGPDDLTIAQLLKRCLEGPVGEVILAVNATVEGQATAHYIMDQLATLDRPIGPPTVTRLAHGVPVGGELDYLDDGTIAQAMRARTKL